MTRREVWLPAADYIARFRDAGTFMEACRVCPGFGRTWVCPPFGFDVGERLAEYAEVRIVACTFDLREDGGEASGELFRRLREPLNEDILNMERELGGMACTFGGACSLCPVCARTVGRPCRYPGKARPSLEACGFDVCRTLDELFGIKLEWAGSGRRPSRMTLAGAVFFG